MRPENRSKVLRMVALIRFFEAGGEINSRELSAMCPGICHRSAQRLLRDAEDFVPLVEVSRGRFRRMEQ